MRFLVFPKVLEDPCLIGVRGLVHKDMIQPQLPGAIRGLGAGKTDVKANDTVCVSVHPSRVGRRKELFDERSCHPLPDSGLMKSI